MSSHSGTDRESSQLAARWSTKYPPLIGLAVVLVVVLALLPSALNIPQSNPNTVPEFAPVPPDEQGAPPPGGNLGSLGLASGSGLSSDGSSSLRSQQMGRARGKTPSTLQCVGNPPRQTEDRLSPPCVAHFEGDNGGATHRGVSGEEVRVVLSMFTGREGEVIDLAQPPTRDNEPSQAAPLRLLQRYFNKRYQTYGRFVHMFLRGESLNGTAEQRRAEASDTMSNQKPFAVISYTTTNGDAHIRALANEGAVTFVGNRQNEGVSNPGAFADFMRSGRGLVWSYQPTVDYRARLFSSLVCRRILGHRVSFSGNPQHDDQPRRLGILRFQNNSNPDLTALGILIRDQVEACGGNFAAEVTFANPRGAVVCDEYQQATTNIAELVQEGVTTVLWAGGHNKCHTEAAGSAQYRPEWVVAGDSAIEGNWFSKNQHQPVWRHARAMTTYPISVERSATPCGSAIDEVSPGASGGSGWARACEFYDDLRQLFTGIQVAGPRLTPRAMDQGYHAIPPVQNEDPRVPGCFFDASDYYACVKDAQVQWWDPAGDDPYSEAAGCWRSMEGGRRYTPAGWPLRDLEESFSQGDRCNGQGVIV